MVRAAQSSASYRAERVRVRLACSAEGTNMKANMETPRPWVDEGSLVRKRSRELSPVMGNREGITEREVLASISCRSRLCMDWRCQRSGSQEWLHATDHGAADLVRIGVAAEFQSPLGPI